MTDMNDRDTQVASGPLRISLGLTLLCTVALGACGNVTAGGFTEAEVYMSGDASQPAMANSGSPAAVGTSGAAVPALFDLVAAALEGDVEVTASILLRQESGSVRQLTPDGPVTLTLDLGGVQEPRVARQVVPAGIYSSMTVTFTQITVDVTGGLEIGGVSFTGPVTVDVGSGLEVTRSMTVVLDEDGLIELLVDLNADSWVPLVDVPTRTVSAADFAGALTIMER